MLWKTFFICSQEKQFYIERKSFLFSTTSTLMLYILYFNYQLVVIKFSVEHFYFCVFLSLINSDHFYI